MSDLPAIPLWFARVTESWEPYERFHGILGATMRRKQLERLKDAKKIEFSCRSSNPGTVKLYARVMQNDIHSL